MSTASPYHGLSIHYLDPADRDGFKKIHTIAAQYEPEEIPRPATALEAVSYTQQLEARRYIYLMWHAAKLIMKDDGQRTDKELVILRKNAPLSTQLSLFDETAIETTLRLPRQFKAYVQGFPKLNACIDHLRGKRKAEESPWAECKDYLDSPITLLRDDPLFGLKAGEAVRPSELAVLIAQLGNTSSKPMLQAFGEYMTHKLDKRQTQVTEARRQNTPDRWSALYGRANP